jgi:hypothetical protein
MTLRWWQVLGFFVVFAGFVWFKTSRHEKLEGRDIEKRLEAFRVEACACTDATCTGRVRTHFEAFLKAQGDTEFYDTKSAYFRNIMKAMQTCLDRVEAR